MRCVSEATRSTFKIASSFDPPALLTPPRPAAQDPFLYQDERGHWHLLMHAMGWTSVGRHAFSRDAANWTISDVAPYTADVTFEDGSVQTMLRRERPQLVLDAAGTSPLFFSSGVEDYSDHTYTLVMEFDV